MLHTQYVFVYGNTCILVINFAPPKVKSRLRHCINVYCLIYKHVNLFWVNVKRLNSIKMWCKTHVLLLQFQHITSSYLIFKNKYNHTQSILIHIHKSNQIGNLLKCY